MKNSPYGPLLVDRRIGSSDLYPLLQRHQLPVELVSQTYGDVTFLGRGEGDIPVTIGLERKRIGDLIASLMLGRLNGHQLPGLLTAYQFTWIIVEGQFGVDEDGHLCVPRKGGWRPLQIKGSRQLFKLEGLEAWLLTVALRGGARIQYTQDAEHTCRWIAALYHWWTQKAWGDHRGHLALDEAIPDHDRMMLVQPTIVQRVAAQLPGIGYEKAKAVSAVFPTLLSMACADLAAWKKIEGIGEGIGRRVVKLVQEGES